VVSDPSPPRRWVAIIGAGPAGLIAAEVIATAGHAVTIYERMPSPARKFLLAGRGGLNLTHTEPLDVFLKRYGEDAPIVRDAVRAFPPERLIAWAASLGQETFTGSSGRIFPKAMKASPLLRAWLRRLDALGVTIKTRHTWTGFADGGGIIIKAPDGTELTLAPDAVLLALGGASWPRLGSDGSWIEAFKSEALAVAPLEPANSGVLIAWSDIFATRFAGAPLKRIAVRAGTATARGEALVTRTGLEGGVIYALSREIRSALLQATPAEIFLDLKPDVSLEELTQRLARSRGSQTLSNFLRKAAYLDGAAIGLSREPGPLPPHAAGLSQRIKEVRLTVNGVAAIERAISTAGGVRLAGLTPGLMIAGKPGVFVAGEMLDWEAPTGGYLLQASFATGVAAAHSLLEWLQ
jgi:uncharacterized flavoprotein (TIGR03862 family)